MERLLKSERVSIMSRMLEGIGQNQTMMDDGLCAYSSEQLTPKEILMRKYRIINCIKCLGRMGRIDIVKDLKLPELRDVFDYMDIPLEELVYDDAWQCSLMKILAVLNEFGEQYLLQCLKDTGWKVSYIVSLEFYDDFESDIVVKCKDSIEFHWKAINEINDEEYESEFLTSLGFEANGYYDFYPDCNVILTNEKIRSMLNICRKESNCCNWEEYKEFRKFLSFSLFDRYYPDVSNSDFRDSDWVCINYLLGEIAHDRVEETGFYQLNYETVICLMIADMVAEDFMARYHTEKKGLVVLDEQRAS